MPAALVVKSGLTDRKEYSLEPGKPYAIGRSRDADVVVKDKRASRRHCTLECMADGLWTVKDHHSSNGTLVNGERITSRELREGDEVRVGRATFEFHEDAAARRPAPADGPARAEAKLAPDGPPQLSRTGEPEPDETPPAPAAAPASSGRAPADEELDDDLKGLFEFLDGIDRADEDRKPARTPPPAADPPAKDSGGALFSLSRDEAQAREAQDATPDAEKPDKDDDEGGGLLDFLRKKKPPS